MTTCSESSWQRRISAPNVIAQLLPLSQHRRRLMRGRQCCHGARLGVHDQYRSRMIHAAYAVGVAILCVHRSEEHTSELQSLMRISYAVFCLKKNKQQHTTTA